MEKLEKILKINKFNPIQLNNKSELFEYLNEEISVDKKIAFGGSMTVKELGLYDFFEKRANPVNWHWMGDNVDDSDNCDIYFVSPNAISEDGKLFFVDKLGNRIRNITSNNKEIYILAGINKIVPTEKDAIKRIETIAAPLNAKRLDTNTPCVKTGVCSHCQSEDRICNYFLKIERNVFDNMKLIIINGSYGY